MQDSQLIYLDHAATTPLDPRVFEAMRPYFLGEFGNAASRQHALGQRAARAVEHAREQLAACVGADPREIVFTSGATEANNMALKGIALAPMYAEKPARCLTGATEHPAVLDPLDRLESEHHIEQVRLPVNEMGELSLDQLRVELQKGARMASFMLANNELGYLHPLGDIAAMCDEFGVILHSDGTQAVGKIPVDVKAIGLHAMSLSAHKFGGPKGVGALYLCRRRPRVRCEALLDGGGHERGMRSGTLNVPGIVGLGAAAELASGELAAEALRVGQLRDSLERELMQGTHGVRLNSFGTRRLPHIANISFEGCSAESLLMRFERVAASSSSACTSASLQPSHVLRALGLSEARIASSVRFSLGRTTDRAALDAAVGEILACVARERLEGPRELCS